MGRKRGGIVEKESSTAEHQSEYRLNVCTVTHVHFAREANRNPLAITDVQFQVLRQANAQDAEIVEALGVMEVFTSFNKFLDSLQVDVDF
jgi:hypothetical protein